MDPFDPSVLPFVIAGFIVSFLLAFGVGANDVANSFGTSVGSGVLNLRSACIVATIFEVLGAILMGYKVSDTIRKGILDVSLYNNSESELMLGSLAALGGSSVWNLLATFLGLPISGTHTIVGATVGFSLCARGFYGVSWSTFGKIVASWFVSPLLSGAISTAIYVGVRKFILQKKDPVEPGLKSLPLFYGFTLLVNVFSVIHDGPSMLMFDRIPLWGALVASVGVGLLTAVVVWVFIIPYQRRKIEKITYNHGTAKFIFGTPDDSRSHSPSREFGPPEEKEMQMTYKFPENSITNGYAEAQKLDNQDIEKFGNLNKGKNNHLDIPYSLPPNESQLPLVVINEGNKIEDCTKDEGERPEVGQLFSFLQILTATFGSFAHGGNDVSNAIGPLIALWAIYSEGSVAQKSEPSIFILLYGGVGIAVGLWVWGRRVIKTIGEDLTKVTPSSGFTIEIGAAFTVLMASKVGLPISTTHCKVGSVVFVGWTKSSKKGVNWKLFRNIVIAWAVTVPLTAAISAFFMFLLSVAFL